MADTASGDAAHDAAARVPFDSGRYLDVIAVELDAISAVLAGGRWDARVPMSSEWTLADLIRHLGGVHRWASAIVVSGQEQPRPAPPADDTDLASWFAAGGSELLDTLRSAEPSDRCWTFSGEGDKAFWYRRQAHETLVHCYDAEEAVGALQPIDTLLAADGVDEVLTVMLPRATERFGDPPRLRAPIALHATDTGHRWLLGTDDADESGQPTVLPEGAAEPAATIEGNASNLLLCVWGRKHPTDVLTVRGDLDAAADLWSGRLTT